MQGSLASFTSTVDADDDDLADAWEVARYGDTVSEDGGGDANNDGRSNFDDYVFGEGGGGLVRVEVRAGGPLPKLSANPGRGR